MADALTWDSTSNGASLNWDASPELTWDGALPSNPEPPIHMPDDNRISASLSPEDKAAILAAFATIREKLPFLINLTKTERRRLPSLGTERGGMDETFAAEMAAHPELVPSYVDTVELEKDRALWIELQAIRQEARELCEAVEDTTQLASHEIYMAYLSFYQNVRQAARRAVLGADTLLDNLRRFIPGRARNTPPSPPAGE